MSSVYFILSVPKTEKLTRCENWKLESSLQGLEHLPLLQDHSLGGPQQPHILSQVPAYMWHPLT